MATRLTFLIDGRDRLSRVFDGAGDAANRMRRRLDDAATRSARSLAGFTRDADGRIRDLQGRFITAEDAANRLRRGSVQVGDGFAIAGKRAREFGEQVKGSLISLAPAAIPMVASIAPIAPAIGAAAVATAAYGAALGPQISAMSEATQAEEKYADAVEKSGRTSEAAVTAQVEYARNVAAMPPATRRAAAGLSVLKDEYKEWSDSLAGDTMTPVTKGLAAFTALLPKTSGLVKGASAQLDRMVTILAGGMESPGLDGLNARFTEFATGTLQKVNDSLVRLMRTGDAGKVGGGVSEFMDYARANGPAVAETVGNVGRALMNVLRAGSEVGVGMLDVVNALTGIVSAVPPGAIAAMLQLAIAIKAVKLASVGMTAARTAMAAFATQLIAMRTAAAGAPGRLAAVTAAIGALGKGAKLAIAGTGIGLLLIALTELSQRGKAAPPDVDRLTSALAKLGATGKVTGEAAKTFGTDLGDLTRQLNEVLSPSVAESINNWGHDISGGLLDAGDATEKLTGNLDSVDDALASLVSGGKADLAKAALDRLLAGMNPEQVKKITGSLDDYKGALADAEFEQQLAAQSMGLFGAQAQDVQGKLDAQKRSTDGLRLSIMALNEVNRAALDGRAGMEAAIDAAAKAAKKHGDALRMSGGELNLNSQKARDASAALNELARKTEGNVSAARDSGKSWEYAKGQYDRGRAALIRSADAMGLTRAQAVTLANQILKTPNKTAYLKGNLTDLQAKLADAKARLARAPASKTTKIKGEISDLQRAVAAAQRELQKAKDRNVKLTMTRHYINITENRVMDGGGGRGVNAGGATGGLYTGRSFRTRYGTGGLVDGPGTGTSDSVRAPWLSAGEFVIKAASVGRYGLEFLRAVNDGRYGRGASSTPMARPAVAGRGGAPTIVNVTVNGAVDPLGTARQIQKLLLQLKRAQGGNVSLGLE